MWGFEPVPKPVCQIGFADHDGTPVTCTRAAPWTGMHIHRSDHGWFIRWPFTGWVYYHPFRHTT